MKALATAVTPIMKLLVAVAAFIGTPLRRFIAGTLMTPPPIPNSPGDLTAGGYAEDRIRMLGPRQVCIHRVSIPFGQIPASSALIASNASIRAFYRNTSPGPIAVQDPNQPYTDQGLWVGVVESSPYTISAATAQ